MKTCVVIPTYNESRSIGSLVRQIKKYDLQVIVIDDGSTDDTSAVARESGAIVLGNQRNAGKGASLIKGFNYALRHDFAAVITMDGDGQHRPEDILYFMRLADSSGQGVLIGNRMPDIKNMPWLRLITNKAMSWFISVIAGQKIFDTQCGFRLIKKEVLEKLCLKTSRYETESEILIQASRLGFLIGSVPIKTIYRGEKSKINLLLDTCRFLKFIFREFKERR